MWRLFLLFLLMLFGSFAFASPWIDPNIHTTDGSPTSFFMTMRGGTARVQQAAARGEFGFGVDKRVAFHAALLRNAEDSQAALMRVLKDVQPPLELTSFWISNEIYVRNCNARLTATVLELLRGRDDVLRVDREEDVQLHVAPVAIAVTQRAQAVGYNLELIGVPAVWAQGVNGTGVVVGDISSGVRYTHEALLPSYKNDGHSWFDTDDTKYTEPADDEGLGTLQMGIMTGSLGMGVAPGAQWICCKAFNITGGGSESMIRTCGQWMLGPTLRDGSQADPTRAPRVVLNPYSASHRPGYVTMFNNFHAVGIIPVGIADNRNASGCRSLVFPGYIDTVLAVGATDADDRLSPFSGLGPSPRNSELLKPEITAPGVGVRGPFNTADDSYAEFPAVDATAAAAAHVAGAIALLLSANPALSYNELLRVLQNTAHRELGFTGDSCEGVADSEFPNFHFGHGRLNVLAAYECVRDGLACLPPRVSSSTGASSESTEGTTESVIGSEDGLPSWLLPVLVAAAALVVVILAALIGWRVWQRQRRRAAQGKESVQPLTQDQGEMDDTLRQLHYGVLPLRWCPIQPETSAMGNYTALTTPYDTDRYEVDARSVQINKQEVLGSGQFGVVHSGVLLEGDRPEPTQVAVKKLKSSRTASCLPPLLKELQVLIHIGAHPNVVHLLGAHTKSSTSDGAYIVLELCPNGSLDKYLRACRMLFTGSETAPGYNVGGLLAWTTQIASGMAHLAEKRIVHADLACRNVLLDANMVAKVSDFGLAAQLGGKYAKRGRYVRVTGGAEERPLPWRWMAVESLRDLRFSLESDVWSFGVTMWEVFSFAETPYKGVGVWNAGFVRKLEAGLRNERPEGATDELYEVMGQCWAADPAERPGMGQLKNRLERIAQGLHERV